jgi:hypothetical protein
MAETTEQKIQQLEIDTVRAVTEMRGDIKNLTTEVKRLSESISRMSENYVLKEDHIQDMEGLRQGLREAKKIGTIRAILYSVATAVMTTVVVYEVMKITK